MITLVHEDQDFYMYDTLSNVQLFQCEILPSQGSGFGAYWVFEDTLRFAMSHQTGGRLMINICELQQTLTPPFCVVSLFQVPPHEGEFSFSPVSFHASFVTQTEVIILDVQDSKLLLHTTVVLKYSLPLGQFSPNGCFFIYETLESEICVWQNTATGYIPWSTLRPRLPIEGFSWSPTSLLILCWCTGGILLLHPGNHPSSPSPDRNNTNRQQGVYLVGYSTDRMHIIIVQKGDGVVTVLNCLSGTMQLCTNTDMQIQDIQIIDNTIFVVDMHKLASWDLEAGGLTSGIHKTLAISADAEHLTLSNDCSQIAFIRESGVFLYDVKSQEILKSFEHYKWPTDIRFSPDGHQLWVIKRNGLFFGDYLVKLDMAEDWTSVTITSEILQNPSSWANLFSPHGYHFRIGSEWVLGSGDRKLLWSPPHWREEGWDKVRWEGNFMALVGGHNPVPITIEFQP